MKAFLDTSVLIATFFEDHVHHLASFDLFTRYGKRDVSCSAHSLFEVYSVLTRLPGKDRIGSEQAMLFIDNIHERLAIVALNADEYLKTLRKYSERSITGGMIYDALLAGCALKARTEILFTWNISHFARLGPEVASIVQTP